MDSNKTFVVFYSKPNSDIFKVYHVGRIKDLAVDAYKKQLPTTPNLKFVEADLPDSDYSFLRMEYNDKFFAEDVKEILDELMTTYNGKEINV